MTVSPAVLLQNEIVAEFPDFKIVKKADSFFMKAIAAFLWIITFSEMNAFMQHFTTTIGQTMYVSATWDTAADYSKIITLRHERVHLRQAKRDGRFLFSLRYLFLPFPIFWSSWRVRYEQEAYEESIKAAFELGVTIGTPAYREWAVGHFLSSEYFWMSRDRASIERWFDGVTSRLKK